MKINIEDYLSKEEIKEICANEIRRHIRDVVGEVSVSSERERILVSKFAKNLAKEGVQEIIPNFKELINEHIKTEISKVTLSDFFFSSLGWRSEGNKVLNSVLDNNKELLTLLSGYDEDSLGFGEDLTVFENEPEIVKALPEEF